MKKLFLLICLAVFNLIPIPSLMAQCSPADSITCPDPEGNGAICPDTLQTAYLNTTYNQVVTMLIPKTYNSLGIIVPLDHVQLDSVGGLPPGIQWESNADSNIFMAGKYYCVLFSGTPSQNGHYVLKIYVDVYSSYNNIPLRLGQTVDSTSLWIDVEDANAIRQFPAEISGFTTWPNPFKDNFRLAFNSKMATETEVDIYNLLGQSIYHRKFISVAGKNSIPFNGINFSPQTMIIRLQQNNRSYTKIINKTH